MFFRCATDGTQQQIPLENLYAGPDTTACWIIGGGPSLSRLAIDKMVSSPAPRFTINLAGSGLFRPHLWTSYDPTSRFHRSIYLDPSVTKFVHEGRAMDLVPETTFKVCDCPSLYLIDRETQRGFHDFPGQGVAAITDWQDSLIQAIDIAYRLGFRQLFLAGSEMEVAPSRKLVQAASRRGVTYSRKELLGGFIRRCEQSGMPRSQLEELATDAQYHFSEQKSLAAAIQTDAHYFRVAQTLRLCRRSLALAGLQLISVTPGSRLNDDFPFLSMEQASRRIQALTGDPAQEQTQGRYSEQQDRRPRQLGPMRDVRPHFWPPKAKTDRVPVRPAGKSSLPPEPQMVDPRGKLRQALDALPEIAVDLNGP